MFQNNYDQMLNLRYSHCAWIRDFYEINIGRDNHIPGVFESHAVVIQYNDYMFMIFIFMIQLLCFFLAQRLSLGQEILFCIRTSIELRDSGQNQTQRNMNKLVNTHVTKFIFFFFFFFFFWGGGGGHNEEHFFMAL